MDYLISSISYGYQRHFSALEEDLLTIVSYITFIGLILGGIFFIEKIVKWILISFHLKKVTIQGSIQAETGNDEESIFDKNMDEIIYFLRVLIILLYFLKTLTVCRITDCLCT